MNHKRVIGKSNVTCYGISVHNRTLIAIRNAATVTPWTSFCIVRLSALILISLQVNSAKSEVKMGEESVNDELEIIIARVGQ